MNPLHLSSHFIDARLPYLARKYRDLRDEAIFKKDMKTLQTYEYSGACYQFYGSSLGDQFALREVSGELSAMRDLLADGIDTFIDVGANHGLFSLLACNSSGCKRIISVEPCWRNYQMLLRNLSLQSSGRKLMPFHLAVGSTHDFMPLSGGLEGASLVNGWGGITATYSELTQVLTLDLLSKFSNDDSRILVKIDAEGYEKEVLSGASNLISSGRACFVVELSLNENLQLASKQNYLDTFDMMLSSGMQAYTFPGGACISIELARYWATNPPAGNSDSSLQEQVQPERTLNILFRRPF